MTSRPITLVREGRPTLEGAGVQLHRVFGSGSDNELFDPFLMMDDFTGDRPSKFEAGFPWHPHRGIETITYMIEGSCDHADSMGNSGTIHAGDVQWMTAGSGIVHQEMPHGTEEGRMSGFQLWANLPSTHKMRDPRYQGIVASQVPLISTAIADVRIIAGSLDEITGPVRDVTVDPTYLDVRVHMSALFGYPVPVGHTVFAYLFEGDGRFGVDREPVEAGEGKVILFGDGDLVEVRGGQEGARFLLIAGKPLHEPIAWRGPIVMNTPQELATAWRELDEGTFIKHAAEGPR